MMAVAETTRTRNDQRSSREIQRDIEAKRQEMDQTLEEISEHLHPRRLLDASIDFLRSLGEGSSTEYAHKARAAGKQIGRQLKQHPVPLLLVGAGVAWWLMESADDDGDADVLAELPTYRFRDPTADSMEPVGPPRRLPAAWEDDYDWSAAEQDQQSWSAKAQAAIDELRTALAAEDVPEEDRIRAAAVHLSSVSGRKRRELHDQWANLREHSGSVVDARTGEPYDETYGHDWESFSASEWTAGGERDRQSGWGESARGTIHQLRQSLEDTTRSVKHKLRDAADHLTSLAQQTRGKAGSMAERGRHATERSRRALEHGYSQAAGSARHVAQRTREGLSEGYVTARESFTEAVDRYPLAVGAAVFGLGLLAGLAVPETRQEDRWMGEASDEVKQTARDFAEEAASRGVAAAKSAASAVGDELQQQGVTAQHAKEVAERAASKAAGAAQEQLAGGDKVREPAGSAVRGTEQASQQEPLGQQQAGYKAPSNFGKMM